MVWMVVFFDTKLKLSMTVKCKPESNTLKRKLSYDDSLFFVVILFGLLVLRNAFGRFGTKWFT